MTKRIEDMDYGFTYRPPGLERLMGFWKLFPRIERAVMIPGLPPEQRLSRFEQVAQWFSMALSDNWQPIGQRLEQETDYDIVRMDERRGGFTLRHIGSGLMVEGNSLSEAQQELSKAVNHEVMGLRQEVKRDPGGILRQVIDQVRNTLSSNL